MLESNLITEMQALARRLDETIDEYAKAGVALADAEQNYNIILRQKALIEKDAGVAVTFIQNYLRGDEEVAKARWLRDVQEARYKTLGEKINAIKLQLRITDSQAGREWSTTGQDYY